MKTKIQIKSIFGSVLFEFEKENNTIKDTLVEAVMRGADLRGADLRSANLRSADLISANLSSADLRSAKTDKRYIQVSCIGSAKRMTTYCFEDDTIWCGCFRGTLDEFEAKVISTHSANDQYLKEYVGFINYLRSLK